MQPTQSQKFPHLMSRAGKIGLVLLTCVSLAACTSASTVTPSHSHMLRTTPPPPGPPQVVAETPEAALPPPEAQEEVYTISVTEMPVRDLLFAMARDANMNIDIYPGITGRVTLSAVNQTLPQILDRISKQVELRYEFQSNTIVVMPDNPYLKIYQVDYVNMNRSSTSSIKVSTQLSTSSAGGNPLGQTEQNQSTTEVTNTVKNEFWNTLINNIRVILGQEERPATTGMAGLKGEIPGEDLTRGLPPIKEGGLDTGEAMIPSDGRSGIVAANPEAGLVSVYASSLQHARIQQLLDSVLDNAQRQVIIESTVVEVELGDRFQEGVDWNSLLERSLNLTATGAFATNTLQNTLKGAQMLSEISGARVTQPNQLPFFSATINKSGAQGAVNATVHALQQFGKVKVLSSPKITALNNQTALMKVVENKVFFTIEAQTAATTTTNTGGTSGTTATPIYNTRVHTVPVGLVMSVTPQIGQDDIVNLNVRPTISRISGWVEDPNPGLQPNTLLTGVATSIVNRIPEIQVREMESMLRISSGQVAVMGGLMQDKVNESNTGLPVLSQLPIVGAAFGFRDEHVSKTELVIFMRPVVTTVGKPKATVAARAPLPGATGFGKPADVPPPPAGPLTDEDFRKGPRTSAGKGAARGRSPAMAQGIQRSPAAAPNPELAPLIDAEVGTLGVDRGASSPPAAPSPATPARRSEAQWQGGAPGSERGRFFVDLGSYVIPSSADGVYRKAMKSGLPIVREAAASQGRTYSRILSGPFTNRADAENAVSRLRRQSGLEGSVATN